MPNKAQPLKLFLFSMMMQSQPLFLLLVASISLESEMMRKSPRVIVITPQNCIMQRVFVFMYRILRKFHQMIRRAHLLMLKVIVKALDIVNLLLLLLLLLPLLLPSHFLVFATRVAWTSACRHRSSENAHEQERKYLHLSVSLSLSCVLTMLHSAGHSTRSSQVKKCWQHYGGINFYASFAKQHLILDADLLQ